MASVSARPDAYGACTAMATAPATTPAANVAHSSTRIRRRRRPAGHTTTRKTRPPARTASAVQDTKRATPSTRRRRGCRRPGEQAGDEVGVAGRVAGADLNVNAPFTGWSRPRRCARPRRRRRRGACRSTPRPASHRHWGGGRRRRRSRGRCRRRGGRRRGRCRPTRELQRDLVGDCVRRRRWAGPTSRGWRRPTPARPTPAASPPRWREHRGALHGHGGRCREGPGSRGGHPPAGAPSGSSSRASEFTVPLTGRLRAVGKTCPGGSRSGGSAPRPAPCRDRSR
jgi:hypothetical protein